MALEAQQLTIFFGGTMYMHNASIKKPKIGLSHKKSPLTFHYTGCLIGILRMVHYSPYITGQQNPYIP